MVGGIYFDQHFESFFNRGRIIYPKESVKNLNVMLEENLRKWGGNTSFIYGLLVAGDIVIYL